MSYNYLDKTGLASVWAKIKAALATKANSADLADIATSGSYDDLKDIPEILTTNDDVVIENQVPYLFRKSPDSDRAVEEIVGGTVGWNQLAKFDKVSTQTSNGITFTKNNDDSYSITGTATGRASTNSYVVDRFNAVSGHKYLIGLSKDIFPIRLRAASGISNLLLTKSTVVNCTADTYMYFNFDSLIDITDAINIAKLHIIISDLTVDFGTTIADYIYSLEQSTAGAGVAKLKEWGFFTEDYYEYCEPTLRSVEGLVSKKTVGWNQWDEEWEVGGINGSSGNDETSSSHWRTKNYIPILPDTTYYLHGKKTGSGIGYGRARFYDADKKYIGTAQKSGYDVNFNNEFTSPVKARFVRFAPASSGTNGVYPTGACLNLSDPTRNGQYEPYESHTYSLDSEVVLRGVPKLDSNNDLYYDGDVYPADGVVRVNWKEYEFTGNETWQAYTAWNSDHTWSVQIASLTPASIDADNLLCEKYPSATLAEVLGGTKTAVLLRGGISTFYVSDPSLTSADDCKAKFTAGTKIIYKATPTTFTAQPYHNPQIVGDTEEFVTTGLVPVGHATKYHTHLYVTNSDLAKVATTGNYNDLNNKPTIPIVPTTVSSFTNDAGYMAGMTILSYGSSSWQDFINAYTGNKVVYCRASSNSNPASGSQTRLAFMAYVNNAENPTEVEFQYYRSVSSHSNSQQGDQVYVYKLTKSGGWTVTVRESYTKVVAGTGLSGNWASGAITLSLNSSATATTSANGLMSSADKSRLDELYADYSSALTALGGS